MHAIPDADTFQTIASQATGPLLIPVYRRLFADVLTPVLAYRRLVSGDDRLAPSFLLESVEGGDRAARYSFLGAQPAVEVVAHGNDIEVRDNTDPTNSKTYTSDDPLGEMQKLTDEVAFVSTPGLPDFTGGWVGHAGYDVVRYLEGDQLPDPPQDDRRLPDLHMQLYHDVVAFDHVQKCVLVITHAQVSPGGDASAAAYADANAKLDELIDRLTTPPPTSSAEGALAPGHIDLASPPRVLSESSMGQGGYQQAVLKAKEYIAAGDIFQVVPSQRFRVETKADPFDVYRALRVINPSPYMFYLQIDGGVLVASSPEILCRVKDGRVVNRPLAGTRKRGATESQDDALETELREDPKDVAEHVMLVDLGRNDVGRVAQPGTIELPELLIVERYSHVMHLSSTVTGQLKEGMSCWDALRHTLPVGTVSGAPKVRAMQIIDELEPVKRGPYAGAVGYADLAGNMDMAIALRTMVVMPKEQGGWVVDIQAGAGIVADSDPQLEHEETVNKAAALAKAVDLAEAAFLV
ncbi:MAG: anthranilate synthase component I [Phycisphaeraceae bacterium]|nr:anthranilate synthase component I [Phycisphaeraceae bacterium]